MVYCFGALHGLVLVSSQRLQTFLRLTARVAFLAAILVPIYRMRVVKFALNLHACLDLKKEREYFEMMAL